MNEELLHQIKVLSQKVEEGDEGEVERLIDELGSVREKSLFNELGKLTRQFHEALNGFRLDSRVANFAEKDFPDARERLRYVITMTSQSADRSLTAAEESIPVCNAITSESQEIEQQWQQFTNRQLSADQFRELSQRVEGFFGQVSEGGEKLRGNLNEVILAQDFQDLTGQIITRVITLVDEMEHSLVDLIRISGENLSLIDDSNEVEQSHEDKIKAEGPAVPGLDTEGTVSGQDEVDDLLSSLGF